MFTAGSGGQDREATKVAVRYGVPAVAALLLCVVVGITDGDTLTARCDSAADARADDQGAVGRGRRARASPALRHALARAPRVSVLQAERRSPAHRRRWRPRQVRAHGRACELQRHRREHRAGPRRHGLGVRPLRIDRSSTRCKTRPELRIVACGQTRSRWHLGNGARPRDSDMWGRKGEDLRTPHFGHEFPSVQIACDLRAAG